MIVQQKVKIKSYDVAKVFDLKLNSGYSFYKTAIKKLALLYTYVPSEKWVDLNQDIIDFEKSMIAEKKKYHKRLKRKVPGYKKHKVEHVKVYQLYIGAPIFRSLVNSLQLVDDCIYYLTELRKYDCHKYASAYYSLKQELIKPLLRLLSRLNDIRVDFVSTATKKVIGDNYVTGQ
jgi:hypothetical protein